MTSSSKSKNSAFEDATVYGKVLQTLVAGATVYAPEAVFPLVQ
jgi:dihydroorotase-like cyclic amidohydrolase